MRKILIVAIAILQYTSGTSQMIDNEIFRKIRKESYDKALSYGLSKLEDVKGTEKYNKKAVPYLLGLGMVYRKMGNYPEAEKYYFEARRILQVKEESGEKKRIIDYDVFDELAMMYLETGNFSDAEEIIQEGIKAREKRFSKTNLLRYRSYLVYGNYFFRTNQYDSAYQYFEKYIFYIKNSRHTSKEELNRYADTYKMLAQMELRKNNATQALVYARKNKHLQFHNWTKKEAGKNNLNKIIALNLLSQSYRMLGDLKKADLYSDQAFDHYYKVIQGETYDLVPLLMNRGFIYWTKKQYQEASKDFIKASNIQVEFIDRNFRTLSEYEKENFYESLRENFNVLNSFAVDQYTAGNASNDSIWGVVYDFHIRTKAIILNESNRMLHAVQNSDDQELQNQFSEWKKLKNELAKKIVVEGISEEDISVKELKSSINQLEKQMSTKTLLFNQENKSQGWKEVKKKLKNEEAAMEVIRVQLPGEIPLTNSDNRFRKNAASTTFGLMDSVAYLFLKVSPQTTSPEAIIVREGNQLEGKHYKFYQNSKLYKIDDTKSYNYFWKPLSGKMSGVKRVYFSADGVYNLINLWILKNPATGSYLIDEVEVVNLTNTRQLLDSDKYLYNISSVLLLGRPNYSMQDSIGNKNPKTSSDDKRGLTNYLRGGVNDLPGTETEIKTISTQLNKRKVDHRILMWNEASEELLKEAESHHVMHIATHGFFHADGQGRNPMLRSGLLLAGITGKVGKEDGILTAYEASNLDLSTTALVVLSACETGLGEVKAGEGVYGLQRAFEVAGVNSILMSMWKVNDQTTQELMVIFYEELLTDKVVLDAFRKAQLKIREKYPEPLYWGAFKLVGY